MTKMFSLRLTRFGKQGYRMALVAALLVIVVIFGVFSSVLAAPPAGNYHGSVPNAPLQAMQHVTVSSVLPQPMEE
jgi:hypothetical protein